MPKLLNKGKFCHAKTEKHMYVMLAYMWIEFIIDEKWTWFIGLLTILGLIASLILSTIISLTANIVKLI